MEKENSLLDEVGLCRAGLEKNYGDDQLEDRLLACAGSGDWHVRLAVAETMAFVRPEKLHAFSALLGDPNSYVEKAAAESMRKSGAVFGMHRKKAVDRLAEIKGFEEVKEKYGGKVVEDVRRACRKVMMRDIAQVGHDISNLLSPLGDYMDGLAAVLAAPMGVEERKQAMVLLGKARDCAAQMGAMAEDIHTFSHEPRMEARTPEQLSAIVAQAYETVLAGFRARKTDVSAVRFESDVPGDVVCSVVRVSMLRVFQNLIKNAFESYMTSSGVFTPGVVSVSACPYGGGVRVEVRDGGRGMDAAELRRARMFEPTGVSGKPGGTGFGLSIAHRMVVAHGGTMDVESARRMGTVFTIYLPYKGE